MHLRSQTRTMSIRFTLQKLFILCLVFLSVPVCLSVCVSWVWFLRTNLCLLKGGPLWDLVMPFRLGWLDLPASPSLTLGMNVAHTLSCILHGCWELNSSPHAYVEELYQLSPPNPLVFSFKSILRSETLKRAFTT